MDKNISHSEDLTRYILNHHYIRSNKTVRWNALIPNRDGETSVYRITGISDTEIFEIGEMFVANLIGKPLLGRTDIGVLKIFKQRLNVRPEPSPHPRHANIYGWPDERPEQRLIAMELAAEAQLHLVDNSG